MVIVDPERLAVVAALDVPGENHLAAHAEGVIGLVLAAPMAAGAEDVKDFPGRLAGELLGLTSQAEDRAEDGSLVNVRQFAVSKLLLEFLPFGNAHHVDDAEADDQGTPGAPLHLVENPLGVVGAFGLAVVPKVDVERLVTAIVRL